eukprot:GHRQ01023357.1.p2 GENE.GHRQ01023357.1~~GHRQ01023357.1.p2  ORF type:complete len:100 (-),score=11.07 GHRQ01023357.1:428-727(-)
MLRSSAPGCTGSSSNALQNGQCPVPVAAELSSSSECLVCFWLQQQWYYSSVSVVACLDSCSPQLLPALVECCSLSSLPLSVLSACRSQGRLVCCLRRLM